MATTTPKKSTSMQFTQFLGVDFANEETKVDVRRSPWAPNITADLAGMPETRVGYETTNTYSAQINGLHVYHDSLLVHAGTGLYNGNELVFNGLANAKSVSFVMNGILYLLDGSGYYSYDGTIAGAVAGFVPTTTIGRMPTGGGTTLEAVNLLTPRRKNSFTTDGTATVFQLDATELDDSAVIVHVGGVAQESTAYTVDRAAGTVTFVTAPPDDAGVDSVVIEFSKTIAGYRARIEGCTICATYGLGSDSRVFVSGNPAHKNTDWQSGLYDPTYFPDLGYTRVGSENTAIMGYLKQYESMIIVKEQDDRDTGLYLRTAELQSDGTAIFPVKEGIAGVGAVSKHCFVSLQGDQMFLGRDGVFGLDSNSVTNQRSVQLRSWYVNPRLVAEENMQNAVACAWGRFYALFVNDHAYIANREATNGNPTGSYGYEWYYWEDLPCRVAACVHGRLYLGGTDGKLRRMKRETECGMQAYSDDGAGIVAMWTTPLLDGGNFLREKTISKKGTGIEAKPYTRSSGEIFFTTDKTFRKVSREYTLDVLDFDDVDFNRFTFNTRDNPRVIISPKKFRKVLQFQMGVRHTAPNEGFGVLKMMISFTLGNLTRRK